MIEAGADPKKMIVVDRKGILHPEREDIDQLSIKNRWKYELALKTNGDRVKGVLVDALKGADALIAAAGVGPNLIKKEEIAQMNKHSIAFLLANPVPEMLPPDAIAAGAEVVATGRSDYPNQVNNSLLFPAIFRGALDVRARTITDTMVVAAARELARHAKDKGLTSEHILPTMVEWEVYPKVAATVGDMAVREGHARKKLSRNELLQTAMEMIGRARKTMDALRKNGIILEPPE
jgi:malate dehydrogenase (oxaloacetate-decarboxylating)